MSAFNNRCQNVTSLGDYDRVKHRYNPQRQTNDAFDGRVVAAISSLTEPRSFPEPPGTITVWNVDTKQRVVEVKDAHRKHFAMTGDGVTAVTAIYDPQGDAGQCRFRVWNVADGKERVTSPEAFVGRGNAPSLFRFSPDGKSLVYGDDFMDVLPNGENKPTFRSSGRFYEVATGQERFVFPLAMQNRNGLGEPSDRWTLAEFSSDSKLLVTVANDGSFERTKVTLWDVAAGKELATLPNPDNFICVYAAFAPDGKTLATMTFGSWIREYVPATAPNAEGNWIGTRKLRMERSDANDSGMTGGTGGLSSLHPVYEIHLWDVATRERQNRFIVSWRANVEKMTFSGDGQSIYTISNNKENGDYAVPTGNHLQVWDVKTGTERGSIGDYGTRFHALAYAADGRLLALTEQRLNVRLPDQYPSSYQLRVWDADSKKELTAPQLFTAMQLPVDLDPKSLTVSPNTPPVPDAWSDAFGFGGHSSTATSPDGKLKAVRGYRLPIHSTGPDGKLKIDPSPMDVTLVDAATGEVLHVLRS